MAQRKKRHAQQPQPQPRRKFKPAPPQPTEPYVISEELGRTITDCLAAFDAATAYATSYVERLRNDKNLKAHPALLALLEDVISQIEPRRPLHHGDLKLSGCDIHLLDAAVMEGLPKVVAEHIGSRTATYDIPAEAVGGFNELAESVDKEDFTTGSETLDRYIRQGVHLGRFLAASELVTATHDGEKPAFEFSDLRPEDDLAHGPLNWHDHLIASTVDYVARVRTYIFEHWRRGLALPDDERDLEMLSDRCNEIFSDDEYFPQENFQNRIFSAEGCEDYFDREPARVPSTSVEG